MSSPDFDFSALTEAELNETILLFALQDVLSDEGFKRLCELNDKIKVRLPNGELIDSPIDKRYF